MGERLKGVLKAGIAGACLEQEPKGSEKLSDLFGRRAFNSRVMEQMLPQSVFQHVRDVIAGKTKLSPDYADTIAVAMKEWALSHGATHYCHWFQPMTGASAEKQDTFVDFKTPDTLVEKFDGKKLLQGEPDASSFPSGGLRCTYEARGYTGWDPTTPPFLWKVGGGLVLCIPTVFFSWTGEALDSKIPLLRSDHKISHAVDRLLKLFGEKSEQIFSTLGWEQEYFVVDRQLRNLRPDLVATGRTLYGAPSPKGQELQDHYFGSVKDRILSYMRDFEARALELGIPVKTRHNEVAPAQHEIACSFERASRSVDHNILMMEVMRQAALDHGLACLLHEKPFAGINGSGKHNNWSLGTVEGENLLDPSLKGKQKELRFTLLITAILSAVHKHASLLRAAIGSAGNDLRLGGHEAPPAIISVYLGEALESYLSSVEKGLGVDAQKAKGAQYDLGVTGLPLLPKDDTDRNRTSPFAFTGTKFEFRAVGSDASCALPITIINVIVAEELHTLLDEIEPLYKKTKKLEEAIFPVVKKYLKQSKAIRFSGDNYTEQWRKEAAKRKLPNHQNALEAVGAFATPSTKKVFENVLDIKELKSLQNIYEETYFAKIHIEVNAMLDLFYTQIVPTAQESQRSMADSLSALEDVLPDVKTTEQSKLLRELVGSLEKSLNVAKHLKAAQQELHKSNNKSLVIEKVIPAMQNLRELVDHMETLVEDKIWPLPKYRELLFLV